MDKKTDLEVLVEGLREHFNAELSLLYGFTKTELDGRAREVRVVVASARSTGNSVYLLSRNIEYFYAEAVMLARSFIEKISNFCYLQVCDEIEFERFLLHPLYRAFHNTDRSKRAGKHKIAVRYSGRGDMKQSPEIKRALSLFSEKDHRMNLSKLSLDQRVAVIADRTRVSPEFFLMNTLTIYSDASEALHGSLYGCALSTGAYVAGSSPKDAEAIKENLLKNIALLYVQMGSLIHELLNIFSENERVKPLFEASKKNHELATSIVTLIFKPKSG